uniref:ARAD1A16456p n=1 Tax=Blastobotrys adeninivorans TaxID=409370 RepID=A0A060T3K4_BLAAD
MKNWQSGEFPPIPQPSTRLKPTPTLDQLLHMSSMAGSKWDRIEGRLRSGKRRSLEVTDESVMRKKAKKSNSSLSLGGKGSSAKENAKAARKTRSETLPEVNSAKKKWPAVETGPFTRTRRSLQSKNAKQTAVEKRPHPVSVVASSGPVVKGIRARYVGSGRAKKSTSTRPRGRQRRRSVSLISNYTLENVARDATVHERINEKANDTNGYATDANGANGANGANDTTQTASARIKQEPGSHEREVRKCAVCDKRFYGENSAIAVVEHAKTHPKDAPRRIVSTPVKQEPEEPDRIKSPDPRSSTIPVQSPSKPDATPASAAVPAPAPAPAPAPSPATNSTDMFLTKLRKKYGKWAVREAIDSIAFVEQEQNHSQQEIQYLWHLAEKISLNQQFKTKRKFYWSEEDRNLFDPDPTLANPVLSRIILENHSLEKIDQRRRYLSQFTN